MQCVFEKHLQDHIPGSAFDQSVLQARPHPPHPHEFVDEVASLFLGCPGSSEAPWHKASKRLQGWWFSLCIPSAYMVHRAATDSSQNRHGRANVTVLHYKWQ